jgi:hypothetical protein
MSFFSSTWINGASMPQVLLRAGGGAALCDLYFFEPANTDFLEIPETVDFTIVYATFNGTTGLNPIFIDTPTDSPEAARTDFSLLVWNTEVVTGALESTLCTNLFDGVFAYFILDGVIYTVDQGFVVEDFELYDSLELFDNLELYSTGQGAVPGNFELYSSLELFDNLELHA